MSKRKAAAKRGAATKQVQKEIAAKNKRAPVKVAVEEGIVIAGKKTYPRFKERVQALQENKNMPKAEAEAAVSSAIEKEGYRINQLVQYYDEGLRAGYLADVPSAGQVWIQPIGPRGAELPLRKHVKLENVVSVIDGKFAPQEIQDIMATKTKKSNKKMAKSNAAPKSKAARTPGAGRGRKALSPDSVIKLKKGPAEGAIKRHQDILGTLKDAGGSMTLKEFGKEFEKRVKTKQDGAKIFGMHKKALEDGGHVTVTEPEAKAA